MNELERINSGIEKTGFVLEHKICSILEKHKWSVINNRYYVDDSKNIEREIDIVAYKTKKEEDIHFYTCLLISCKKSNENIWAFLTKNFDKNDPNINFYPILNWTNVEVLKYMLKQIDNNFIKKNIKNEKDIGSIFKLNRQVFAFQEMNKNTGSPQNDKNIYNSIITVIKASEYERNSLNKRKKIKAFYNFNLISIFEGEIAEIYFHNSETEASKIDSIKYLNRHIINNKEEFYRVHFIKSDRFKGMLTRYGALIDWNCKNYYNLFKEYYLDVFEDRKRVEIF